MTQERSYRTTAAEANRRKMIDAARECFIESGYTGTTIKAVAQRCGLSQESLYKTFGGKAGLLKAVYDTTLAGDDTPVPMAVREHGLAVRDAASPDQAAHAWADMVIALGDRIGPLLAAVNAAGATDTGAAQLLETMNQERLAGARMVADHWAGKGWLDPAREPHEHARTLWLLNSPEVRHLATQQQDSTEDYHQWLIHMVRTSVLRDHPETPWTP